MFFNLKCKLIFHDNNGYAVLYFINKFCLWHMALRQFPKKDICTKMTLISSTSYNNIKQKKN